MFRELPGSRHRTTPSRSAAIALRHTLLAFVLVPLPTIVWASDWTDGVAAFQAGNLDEAAAAFARHIERAPNQYQGHLMLGQVQRGGQGAAVEAAAQAVGVV